MPAVRMNRPLGVTLIAFFQILSGVTFLVDSLIATAYSSWASSPEGQERLTEVFSENAAESIAGILFVLAFIYLVLGISTLLLARGLFKGYEKARRRTRTVAAFAIVFAFLGAILLSRILPERLDIQATWWSIIFNIVVLAYLGRPGIRAYFASR
ncbi:MAG TPA: hypothetical protein VGB78_08530 [Thermoplasmata archaeon]|jgi:succinate dehydrogenase/fumarate reductase cytochrome b subunit